MRRSVTGATLVALAALALPAPAVAQSAGPASERPFLDVRGDASGPTDRAPVPAAAETARDELERSLGLQGVVSEDPASGGARVVGRTDGTLTEASSDDAVDIALRYVRDHRDVFRLDDQDL